ncbi:hypothetical protein ACOMHN_005555 [Nucella lapillus]
MGHSEYKCVIVGDGGVGKTSMLIRYVNDDFLTEYMPTCFDSYSVPVDMGDRHCSLVLIDTAGQETYDRLRTLSYYNTDVFVVCFSVANPDSYLNVRSRWVPELHAYRPGTPFLLVGTQADLRLHPPPITPPNPTTHPNLPTSPAPSTPTNHSSSSSFSSLTARVPVEKGRKLARKIGAVEYLECSALTGSGLNEVFRQALMCALRPSARRKSRCWSRLKRIFVKG